MRTGRRSTRAPVPDAARRAEPAPAPSGTGHGRRLLGDGSLEKVRDPWWLYRSVGRPVQPPSGFPARIIPCRGDHFPPPLDHHLPWRRRRWKRPKPSLEFERDRPFGAREDVRALHTSPVRAMLFDAERRCGSPCIIDLASTNPCAFVMSKLARDGLHPLRQHDVWRWRRLLLVATAYPPYSWGERVSMPSSTIRTDGSSSFETTIPTTRSDRSGPERDRSRRRTSS
jgi:hypothetical protein